MYMRVTGRLPVLNLHFSRSKSISLKIGKKNVIFFSSSSSFFFMSSKIGKKEGGEEEKEGFLVREESSN